MTLEQNDLFINFASKLKYIEMQRRSKMQSENELFSTVVKVKSMSSFEMCRSAEANRPTHRHSHYRLLHCPLEATVWNSGASVQSFNFHLLTEKKFHNNVDESWNLETYQCTQIVFWRRLQPLWSYILPQILQRKAKKTKKRKKKKNTIKEKTNVFI